MPNTATALSTDLSGIYIPQKWSKKLIMELHPRLFLNLIANTDYEGEIKDAGDVVKIRRTPKISVKDYTARGQLDVEEITGPAVIDLAIDKGKYYAFNVDDLERFQSDVDYAGKAMEEAATSIKEALESDFLVGVRTGAAAANMGANAGAKSQSYNMGAAGSPVTLTKDNALDYIIDAGSVLDEQNVPEKGRYIVIPPAVANRIKKSDIKAVYVTGDEKSSLRTGNIGMIDRFNVFVSNMMTPVEDNFYPIFGCREAVTFATQLVKNEVVPREKHFGKVHRGLCVYGYKVVMPEGFGVGCVKLG
jgi:N4-gp56 family major capsid protein